jgi:hypothetical protein
MELPAKLNLKNELLTETTQFTNLFSEVGGRAPAVESGTILRKVLHLGK